MPLRMVPCYVARQTVLLNIREACFFYVDAGVKSDSTKIISNCVKIASKCQLSNLDILKRILELIKCFVSLFAGVRPPKGD